MALQTTFQIRPLEDATDLGPHLLRRRAPLPPHATNWDPFILLGEDWFEHGCFPMHPHKGFATFTYVVDGQLHHRDSLGCAGSIGPGDAQWMIAGRGILHEEEPEPGKTVHAYQLWFNVPRHAKLATPLHQDLRGPDMPEAQCEDLWLRVFAGTMAGTSGPAALCSPGGLAEGRLTGDAALPLALDQNHCIVLMEGTLELDGVPLDRDHACWSPAGPDRIRLTGRNARFLVLAGQPLGEPVAWDGPFVMNTPGELEEAHQELRDGRLGIPQE